MKKITLISIIIFLIFYGGVNLLGMTQTGAPAATPRQNTLDAVGNISMAEVSKHNSQSDCYLVINSNIYDVTSFIGKHPGGVGEIAKNCGKEVTGIFTQIHSNKAWDLLAKYKIGSVI